jgi:hypothetical protein
MDAVFGGGFTYGGGFRGRFYIKRRIRRRVYCTYGGGFALHGAILFC